MKGKLTKLYREKAAMQGWVLNGAYRFDVRGPGPDDVTTLQNKTHTPFALNLLNGIAGSNGAIASWFFNLQH